MKRFLLALLVYIGLLFPAFAADRYWVGGTGNWSDNTNHWSATDGGAPGASLPTSSDNVFFTAASNATAYTVTADVTGNCANMSWALPSGSGIPSLVVSANAVGIYGNLTMAAGMSIAGSSGLSFLSTATGKTITTNGSTLNTSLYFGGVGGSWTLQDDLTNGATRTITVTNGTLNTNAKTVTTGSFVSTSGTRTLTLDGSTINITGTSGTPWNTAVTGSLTMTNTGTVINFTGGAAGVALTAALSGFHVSGALGATINMTGLGGAGLPGLWVLNLNSGTNFANFSYLSSTNKTDYLQQNGANFSITANGVLSLQGNSVTARALIKSNTLGTARTITISGTTVPTLINVDFQDFTASGNTPWTGTSLGDCLGNSGITFDAPTTQTWNSYGTSWSAGASRWTSRTPLPQDDVVIGAGLISGTIAVDMPRMGRNIDTSAMPAGTVLSFAVTPNTIFGNITMPTAAPTISGTQALTLAGRNGTYYIISSGKSFPQAVTVAAFGGTYTLLDALTTVSNFTLLNGTVEFGSFDATMLGFISNVAGTRQLNSAGNINITQSSASTPWSISNAGTLTLNLTSSTIKFTGNNGGTLTFAGGGLTYGNFHWSNTSAVGTVALTGANTFADFKVDGTTARTVTFPSSTTTTMSSFTKSNTTAGQLTTINSSTPATGATLSDASGINQLSYMTVTDIIATGGATWNACYATSSGVTSGWNINAGACPAGSTSRLLMIGVSN